ncbi:MAG: hypothetical protein II534_08290 [Clostridia bacterium]|nr:hypothetical protein [Clostridia bacterium]
MRYEMTHDLNDIIDYYKDIKKKFGRKYWNYDPYTITMASGLFREMNSSFKNDDNKAMKLLRQTLPTKIHVVAIRFPVSCGINFSNALVEQVQKQIEEKTGISNIHSVPNVTTALRPFAPNHYWYIDDVFIVHETTDGKRYTFFQAEILCSWHRGDDYLSTIPLVWIKCFYPDHPEKEVDFWDENERISFEICKGPPDSFPAITELPEYIQQNIEMTKNSPLLPLNPAIKITLAYRYEKWTYDRTEAWISELKEFFEKVSSMPPRRTRRVSKKSG